MSKSYTFGAPSSKKSFSRTSVETVEQDSKKSSIANPSKEESQQQASKEPASPPAAFNHGESKYKWCCGLLHVTAGPIVAAFITWYFLWSPIAHCIDLISDRPILCSLLLVYWVLWFPLIICNFIAVARNNRHLLVPFIAYGLSSFIAALILFIVKIVLKEYGSDEVKTEIKKVETVLIDITGNVLWFLINAIITSFCCPYFYDLDNYHGNTYLGYAP